jgi:hypothetical protein
MRQIRTRKKNIVFIFIRKLPLLTNPLNYNKMKKITMLAISLILFGNLNLHAQIEWKLNGNNVSGDSKLGTNTGFDLIFETNNSERIRITDDGKFGIGINSPLFGLDVNTDMRVNGLVKFGAFANTNATESRYLTVGNDGTVQYRGAGALLFDLYRFDCNPFIDFGTGIEYYPAPTWANSAGEGEYGKLWTGSTCPAYVGINTNNPQFALQVNGFTRTVHLGINTDPTQHSFMNLGVDSHSKDGFTIDFNSTNDNKIAFRVNTANNLAKVYDVRNTAYNKSVFSLTGNGLMTLHAVENSGNLFKIQNMYDQDVFRIGVNGVVWSTEVNVALKENFPDYVFASYYKLMSLAELSAYIARNNHLPNVPTAQEVAANGLNLGEMQRIQMEKIEENTLYILQLEERLKKLEAQNEQLMQLLQQIKN